MSVPVIGIVTQGIALSDTSSFLETRSGEAFFKEQVKIFKLSGSDIAWIPTGVIAIPLVLDETSISEDTKEQSKDKDTDKDKAAKAKVEPVFLWSWSPLVPGWVSEIDEQAWLAISAWNKAHIDKNVAQRIWKERSEVFQQFATMVKRST